MYSIYPAWFLVKKKRDLVLSLESLQLIHKVSFGYGIIQKKEAVKALFASTANILDFYFLNFYL